MGVELTLDTKKLVEGTLELTEERSTLRVGDKLDLPDGRKVSVTWAALGHDNTFEFRADVV